MTELDQVWAQMIVDAEGRARGTGHDHVTKYLQLKATNDAIRQKGVAWLLDSMVEIAAGQKRPFLTIEREEPYRFARGSSHMVGSLLEIRQGVRCLTLEAGWARTPSDGIMQKGALAFARITHFGMPRAGCEFRLVHAQTLPAWLADDGAPVDSTSLIRHFDLFKGS